MSSLVVLFLAAYALVFCVQHKFLFLHKYSVLEPLLSCSFCLGFWFGALLWVLLPLIPNILLFGLACASFCLILDSWLTSYKD
jgi:hypothetical protein